LTQLLIVSESPPNTVAGGQAHATTPNFLPTHMARLDEQEKSGKAAMATFVDLMLLARASCLVASDSGFSEAAWLLGGGRPCIRRLRDVSPDNGPATGCLTGSDHSSMLVGG